MAKLTLKAEKRTQLGRKAKNLRKENILPANIYGKDIKSQAIQVTAADFDKVFSEAGETSIVEVMLDSKARPTLVHNIQRNPVSDEIVHIDFMQVDLKQKVTADIPVELVGESPAEKQGLGTLVQQLSEVSVEALPTDLPDKFEVDVTGLSEVDSAILVSDLKVPAGVELQTDAEQVVAKVEPLRAEEEEPAPASVEGEESPEGEGSESAGQEAASSEEPQESKEEN